MNARLFVVDQESLRKTEKTGIASIRVPEIGKQWLKTISDIMADLIQMDIGDYIFLWEVKSNGHKSCIHGIYRVISRPFFDNSNPRDNSPFKIYVEKAYVCKETVNEYDFLNCPYIKTPLWTFIGKKIAGKSRGSCPLSLEETKYLIMLLIGKNPDYKYVPFNKKRVVTVDNELSVDYSNAGPNATPTRWGMVDISKLNMMNDGKDLYFEKTLETIFNQELVKRNKSFFKQIEMDVDKVMWFNNYLPYSIEQSEMDYVVVESEDGFAPSRIYVLEFQKENIDMDHVERCLMYREWVGRTMAIGANIVQPIVIFPSSKMYKSKKAWEGLLGKIENVEEKDLLPLKIFTYDLSSGRPVFERRR